MKETVHYNHINGFYEHLKTEIAHISDKSVEGGLDFNEANYLCTGLILENCDFKETVNFSEFDLKLGVRFINCTFKNTLIFSRVSANRMRDTFNGDNANIYFENCTFSKDVSFVNTQISRSVKFYKCGEIAKLSINRAKIHSVHMESCTVTGVDIQHLDTMLGVRIEKTSVLGQGRYSGCTGDGFSFLNATFIRDQYLWGNRVRSITTNNGSFDEEFKIHACTVADSVSLIGTVFKNSASMVMEDQPSKLNSTVGSLFIKNCDFQGGFEFKGNNTSGTVVNCGKLTISSSTLLKGNIAFDATDIIETVLKGTNTNANISFRNCKFQKVNIDYFTNLGKLYFADLEALDQKDSYFSIDKTALGTAIFLNVNFLGFETIIIKHSHLTDILFTDVKWFRTVQLNPAATFNETVIADQVLKFKKNIDYQAWFLTKTNKEVYRQLKYAATKQGDVVQALTFQGEEMKEFNKELKYYGFQWTTMGNKAMMWLNQSNEYGSNWIKAIVLLLLFNIFFFFMITISQSQLFDWTPAKNSEDLADTFRELWKNIGAYWSLLNPVRRLTDIYEKKVINDGTTIFWDYLDRVLVSYFLFQIVSAFRKYSK